MRLHESWCSLLLLAFGLAVAVQAAGEPVPRSREQMSALVDGNSSFAVDLYQRLRTSEGNLFFSPYSISTALALAYGGAHGQTEKQIAKAAHFDLDQNALHPAFGALQRRLSVLQERADFKLVTANSLWPQQGYRFLDTYFTLAKEHYAVFITPMDYVNARETARKHINLWVEDKTEKKVKDLIPENMLDNLTRLVLVNAVYFKSAWMGEFDVKRTKDSRFVLSANQKVTVPLMTQMTMADYAETQDAQILFLPYSLDVASLVVLLPKKVDGIRQLEDDLTVENLKQWREQAHTHEVKVSLPRFKVRSQFALGDVLEAMGMTDAFHYPAADFSGIADTRELSIGAVVHEAFVEVNEKGTEAAAATEIGFLDGGSPQAGPLVVFRADHPFLFLIQDTETGTILFLGRLTDPTQNGQ
jgi:serine protease inhibitor